MQTKNLIAQLGTYDPYTRSVAIIASTTDEVDGEAITKWDLSRFVKNPVILWSHNREMLPVGLARDVEFAPDPGLSMTVQFGSARANPLAEQLAHCVAEGLVRAVSVGYESTGDGKGILNEVSFCTLGADENAGTMHIDPDHPINDDVVSSRTRTLTREEDEDEYAQSISNAARTLSYHRMRARNAELRGMPHTDAIDLFEHGLATTRVEERLDAKEHSVMVRGAGNHVVEHTFASKAEAHAVGTALRATGHDTTIFSSDSPFKHNIFSGGEKATFSKASPEETRQVAHDAHAAASAREMSLNRPTSAKDQAEKAAKYDRPTVAGLKREVAFHEAAMAEHHASGDKNARGLSMDAYSRARQDLADVQKEARGPRTKEALAAQPPTSRAPQAGKTPAHDKVAQLKGMLAEAKSALAAAPPSAVTPKSFTPEERAKGHEHMQAGNDAKNQALNTYGGMHEKIADLHAKAADSFEKSAASGGSLGLGVPHAQEEAAKSHQKAAGEYRQAAGETNDKAKAGALRDKAAAHESAAKGGGGAGQPRDDHGRWEAS